MASGIVNMIDAILTEVRDIPYTWADDQYTDRSIKNRLFQKVLVWNDQVNREKNGSGYTFQKPACFVELRNNDNQMFADSVSWSEPIVRLHIVDEQLDAGDDETMDQNLQVFEYRDAVKNALVGFQPPQCSTLFTVDEQQDYTHDDVYHYIVDLKCGFVDVKGSIYDPNQTKVIYKTPPPNLGLELNAEFEEIEP